jgi:glutathione S-transferase
MFKRFCSLAGFTLLILFGSTVINASESADKPALDLTIYHLEARRSERIVWLCEELGLPYKLVFTRGDIYASMATIRKVNPLMPVAPTVRIGDQIMVESGAIIELILARYGDGKLRPNVDSADYPYYLQWMHYAEGSFAARTVVDYVKGRANGGFRVDVKPGPRLVNNGDVLKFMDTYLGEHPYFGGAEFSAADIMMLFPMNMTESFGVADMDPYPNLVAWRKKVKERPTYKRTLKVALPDGPISIPPALKTKPKEAATAG